MKLELGHRFAAAAAISARLAQPDRRSLALPNAMASPRPSTAPRRMSYASMRAELHSGGGLRMAAPAGIETWPAPPMHRNTAGGGNTHRTVSARSTRSARPPRSAGPSTGAPDRPRSEFAMRLHDNRTTLGSMSSRTLLRAPTALRQPLLVYEAGDVRYLTPVHPERSKPGVVAPTASFADKQAAVAAFVDGDRVRPALLTSYWPSSPSRRQTDQTTLNGSVPRGSVPRDSSDRGGRRVSDEAVMLIEIVKTRLNHYAGKIKGWDKVFVNFAGTEEGLLDFENFVLVVRGPGKMPEEYLSVRECRIFFEQADLSGTGSISLKEFGLLVHSHNPKFELHMEAMKAKLRASGPQGDWLRLFNFYDKDKSGTLSIDELKVLVRQEAMIRHDQLSDKDIEKIFMLMDHTHRGVVRSSNFVSFIKEPSPRYQRVVQLAKTKINTCKPPNVKWPKLLMEFDNDGSGHLSLGELYMAVRGGASINEKMLSNFELESMFYSIDNNADGHITVGELIEFLNATQTVGNNSGNKPRAKFETPKAKSLGGSVPLSTLKMDNSADAMLRSAYLRPGRMTGKYADAENGSDEERRAEEERDEKIDNEDWTCKECNAVNFGKLLRCSCCRVPKGETKQQVALLGRRNALRPTTSVQRGNQLFGKKFLRQVGQGMRVAHRYSPQPLYRFVCRRLL